jgi:hypothetical protein
MNFEKRIELRGHASWENLALSTYLRVSYLIRYIHDISGAKSNRIQ